MAKTTNSRNVAINKAIARPSRPSMQRRAQLRPQVPGRVATTAKKTATPRMAGKQRTKQERSLAKPAQKKPLTPKQRGKQLVENYKTYEKVGKGFKHARPSRYRSGRGAAKIIPIPERHYPKSGRYKTGHHRITREPWDTNATFAFRKAIFRLAEKGMPKELRKASLGKDFFGKEGPGHAGYGTGTYQRWSDYVLSRNQGLDPHVIDLRFLSPKYLNALNYHFGGSFADISKASKKDQYHFLKEFVARNKEAIPELRNLTKRDFNLLVEHNYHTVTFGPDGRKK